MFVEHQNPVELAKEVFWLAWQACGHPMGMGVFQDNPSATKEDVWNNVVSRGDYPINLSDATNRPYADYVFGRMMKFGLDVKSNGIEIMEKELRPDYQSWCPTYKTVKALVDQAVKNLSFTNN